MTTNQLRLNWFWISMFTSFQWQLRQARRGLLPSYNEPEMAAVAGSYFNRFHSFEDWWEGSTSLYSAEFVEWVEEQRSKAA